MRRNQLAWLCGSSVSLSMVSSIQLWPKRSKSQYAFVIRFIQTIFATISGSYAYEQKVVASLSLPAEPTCIVSLNDSDVSGFLIGDANGSLSLINVRAEGCVSFHEKDTSEVIVIALFAVIKFVSAYSLLS